jgi:hypothetical protein
VSNFSNSAQILDLLAPGGNINSSVPGNTFSFFSGTSMATPHAAGAFAVLRSKAPSASVDEILNALKITGTPILDSRNGITKPRIQIDSALASIGPSPGGGLLTVLPAEGFSATGAVGGPFSPNNKTYTLTNNGDESIDFTVNESVEWADISPLNGTLAPDDNLIVTVSINDGAETLDIGDYVTAVNFTNTTNGRGSTSRPLSLSVTGMAAVNDKFEDSILLDTSSGTTEGSSENASKESDEPNHAGVNGGSSIWWRWTASAAGEVTFDTVGSNFDTVLAAYTGQTVSALTVVASNDDAEGLQSKVTFETAAGTTYHIAVDGFNGASGHVVINWEFTQTITPQDDISVTPDTGFITEGFSGGPFSPASVTYTLTNVSSTTRSFQIQNVPVWLTASQTSGSLAPSQDTTVVFSVNNSANTLQPGNYTGEVLFNDVRRLMTLIVRPSALNNDDFNNASLLTGTDVSTTGSNVGASKEFGEPDHGENPGGKSVWWYWVAPSAETYYINTFGSAFDTTLGVYTGSQVNDLTTIATNDDSGTGLQSQVSFTAKAGTTYFIAVDGYFGDSGSLVLNLILVTNGGAGNDDFNDAFRLRGIPVLTTGLNFGASKEANEPNHGFNIGGRSLWWRWTAPASQLVTVDTFGSNFDTILGIYTGTRVDVLTTIASNDDALDVFQSRVSFTSVAGTAYYIAVDGYNGEVGNIHLKITIAGSRYYNIQVQTNGSGTVTSISSGIDCPGDCAEDYPQDVVVALTAVPAGGWDFTGWSGDCSGTDPCTLSMSFNKSVTANFTNLPFLAVTRGGNGTVESNPPGIDCGTDCSENYGSETTVTLTATAATNWEFAGWEGACTGSGSCVVTVGSPTRAKAKFSAIGQTSVLLVDDDNNSPDVSSAYTSALDTLGMTYSIWDTENSDTEPNAADLEPYHTVVWFTGAASSAEVAGPGTSGEEALGSYLDGGGCLIISGQDYHFARGQTAFMSEYLGVSAITDDLGAQTATGAGSFVGLGPFTLGYPFADFSDRISPDGTADPGFFSSQGNVAVYKDNGIFRTAFLGFPFEAISTDGDRTEVMDALLNHCGYIDTDGDGIPDSIDPDDDDDGMPDDWENWYDLDPLVDDASDDADEDGFSNLREYRAGSNPNDPESQPPYALPWLLLLLGDEE